MAPKGGCGACGREARPNIIGGSEWAQPKSLTGQTQEASLGVRYLWHHQGLTHFNELLDGCRVWSIGVAHMGGFVDRGR